MIATIILIVSLVANMGLLALLIWEKRISKHWKNEYDKVRREANAYIRKIIRTY